MCATTNLTDALNCSLSSVIRKFDAGVTSGVYPAPPKLMDMPVADFACMDDQREWEVCGKACLIVCLLIWADATPDAAVDGVCAAVRLDAEGCRAAHAAAAARPAGLWHPQGT